MFFIVWGRKGITKTLSGGTMHCPLCKNDTEYKLKEIRKYFTLFWVPLFPYGKSVEYVECQRCKTPFNPEFFGLGSAYQEPEDEGNEQE